MLFSCRAIHVRTLHPAGNRIEVDPSQCFGTPGEQVRPYLEFQRSRAFNQPGPEYRHTVLIGQGYDRPGGGLRTGNNGPGPVFTE
jgi:hypothetical protein